MTSPILHAGGIGWDEILVSVVIAAAIALAAFWIDRSRNGEPDREADEPLTGPEREQDNI